MCAEPRVVADAPDAFAGEPRKAAQLPAPGGWTWGYLALAIPALALAADTAWALAHGWRPTFRIDVLVVSALALWLFFLTAWLVLPAGRRFFAQHRGHLILLAASVCSVWLVGELAVGAALARFGDPFHGFRPGMTLEHRPDPAIMRGVASEATARYNDWGVRGANPPPRDEAYRILCLGGSSTACTYLDDANTWPQRLAAELEAGDPARRYWVGNAGVPGFRAPHHLEFVAGSPLVDELDCLVVQTGINDFMSCLAGPRPAPPYWTRSSVRQLVRTLVYRLLPGDNLVEDKSGSVYARRRAVRQAAALDDSTPELDDCLRAFERELDALVDACRARNVRIVFTTQPTLWRRDLDARNAALLWFGQLADGRYLSVAQLRAGMDRYNEALARVCARRKVALVDLSELDGDPAAFYDDCHFTDAGAARVGRLVADALQTELARAAEEPAR
jgi:lysophospholipase L1-like esterase